MDALSRGINCNAIERNAIKSRAIKSKAIDCNAIERNATKSNANNQQRSPANDRLQIRFHRLEDTQYPAIGCRDI
jgi:hypothetical protein